MTDAIRRHDPLVKGFASDNYAGVHPEILQAIALANGGHQTAYGDDVYTEALQEIFKGTSAPRPRPGRCSTAPVPTWSRSAR